MSNRPLLRTRVLPAEHEDALALEGAQAHLRADNPVGEVDGYKKFGSSAI